MAPEGFDPGARYFGKAWAEREWVVLQVLNPRLLHPFSQACGTWGLWDDEAGCVCPTQLGMQPKTKP